ncbi:hypothetical protein [Streptomyces sp. NPDC015131]|uniref:hypothetical protein n=1 Tax=Streptomyces sp. NPDC015131 TaxID=3364941 RepID=UPI0036FB17FC
MTEREYPGDVKPVKFKHAKSGAFDPQVLEEIANEVREFDRIQGPEHKRTKATEDIVSVLEKMQKTLAKESRFSESARRDERKTLAAEVQAAKAMGVPSSLLVESQPVKEMLRRLGAPDWRPWSPLMPVQMQNPTPPDE